MKTVYAAALCCISLAGAAIAQTGETPALTPEQQAHISGNPSRCPEIPPAPELAEPGRGNSAANRMTQANDRYNTWVAAIGPVLLCRQAEVRELRATADAAHALYVARGREFNAGVASQAATCSAWQAQIAEQARLNNRDLPDGHAGMCGADAAQ